MKPQKTYVVTGASGLLGRALCNELEAEGHRVVRVGRQPAMASGRHVNAPNDVAWDPGRGMLDASSFAGADGVVHLAGANVGQRWTPAHKNAILQSRVDGTTLLMKGLTTVGYQGPVVTASAVGIYGNRADVCTEDAPRGTGFLAEVVEAWEGAATAHAPAGARLALARLGVVLAPSGGSLDRMRRIYNLGLGAPLGDGTQWMSWIHLSDAVRALRHCLDHDLSGPVNATAPQPVQNRDFSKALARAMGRPHWAPAVPAWALRMALGEMADVVLHSQRAVPSVLRDAGFAWEHSELSEALRACMR